MEVIIVIILLGVGQKFLGGILTGAETAADGCGKIIGFARAATVIIALLLGLF